MDGTVDGVVSTRRGNAAAWVPLIGRSPVGAWQLTLPDTEEMRSRFRNEEVDDLLLILDLRGAHARVADVDATDVDGQVRQPHGEPSMNTAFV